jgi:glycerol uptake facilitator-like aquaporin
VSATTSQRLVAEFIATAGLLAAVVGSGIMGESLAGGNVAIALLANTLATAAALVALILTFGPISGAHMNPVVTLVEMLEKRLASREALGYLVVQVLGGVAGVWLAHVMFDKPILMTSEHVRSGVPQLVSEAVAAVRSRLHDPRDSPPSSNRYSICCWRVHRRRVLVHRVDLVREPCCDACANPDEYVCRDSDR